MHVLSLSKLRNEMQLPAKQQRKGKRVQREVSGKFSGLQAAGRKVFLPLDSRLIIIRECNTVWPVTNPVHCPQRSVIKRRLAQVVFQQNTCARNARSFAQKLCDVRGVVQHIHK